MLLPPRPDLFYLRVQHKRSRKKATFDPKRIQCAESIKKFRELNLLPEVFKIVPFKTKLNGDSRFSFEDTLRMKLRCLGKLPWLQVEVTQGENTAVLPASFCPAKTVMLLPEAENSPGSLIERKSRMRNASGFAP